MPRIALGLEYDGTDFIGWQIQREGRSVEGTLAAAASFVAGEPVTVRGSGRTDAGVHALQQVAHFDTQVSRTERQWLLGINSRLPRDVAIRWVQAVPAGFDARRSAVSRRYRYTVLQQSFRPALLRRSAWWLRQPLDCAAMTAAATAWLGEHDFSSFRSAGCQAKTPMRRLLAVTIAQRPRGEGTLVSFEFTANAFLQHMVRNFVGTLVAIGSGELAPAAAAAILEHRDRRQAGVTAPPEGLVLVEVLYPPRFGLPHCADEP
jgi:tRNA pseudouridine38-40 synthase